MRRRLAVWSLRAAMGVLLIYPGIGIRWVWYTPARSNAFVWGAYHVHSNLSDGLGNLADIARQAREAGIAFVLLTDHGRPNVRAVALNRIIDGVRIIGGSEVTMPEGHLTLFGAREVPPFKLPPFPPDAVADIREWGGIPVVAYPDDPVHRWTFRRPDFRPGGIEIFNLSTIMRRMTTVDKIRVALMYPFTSRYLLTFVHRPAGAITYWDRLLQNGQVYALAALNTHGGIHIGSGKTLPVPSYRAMFGLMALGVDMAYRDDPLAAIRRGEYFCCLRGAGEPDRFRFEARNAQGSVPQGGTITGPVSLEVRVGIGAESTRITLWRNGRRMASSSTGSLQVPRVEAGVFRVEVYLPDHPLLPAGTPWILSNPIRVRRSSASRYRGEKTEPGPDRLLDAGEFLPEEDDQSSMSWFPHGHEGEFDYHLSSFTGGDDNRWCALARRRPLDLSGYDGVYLRADSDRLLRYFVELRAGRRWYYGSIKVYPGRQTVCRLPFSHFYRVMGGRESLPLSLIDSMFITVSNYTAETGFSSRLTIREVGFYTDHDRIRSQDSVKKRPLLPAGKERP